MPSYTDEQKCRAVDMIEECGGSVTRAMRRLGYPTRHKSSATFSFGKKVIAAPHLREAAEPWLH